MKKTILAVLAISVITGFISCKSSEKTIDLKFNLPKGGKYEYFMDMTMNMDQQVQGRQMKMTTKMAFTYLFEVMNDSAGWKTLHSTITGVKVDINGGGMTMGYDSDSPSADTSGPMSIFNKIYGKMKGQTFTFTLSEKGKVGSVSGIADMMENMYAGLPESEKEAMKQQMSSGFNEESFKQNMEQSFAAYPEKPVKVGESWTKNMTINAQGSNMNSENTYTLESVNGNDAKLKVEAKLSMPASSVNGVTTKMNGTSTGTLHIDIPTGMSTDSKLDMKMNMEITSGGQKMPMETNIVLTTKGKKID